MKKTEFDHITGNYLEVAGANIYYEEIENIGMPVLIFLHAGMGNIADYNPIVPLFADDYHIVGIDSRGHGKSTLGTEKLTYKRLQLDVEAVAKHLQLTNIHVIGFSDGGVVAYRLALSDQISIQKIVTLGAVWGESTPKDNQKFFADTTLNDYIEGFKQNLDFYQQYNPQPNIEKHIKSCEQMWFDESENGYPNINASTINTPTLIVRGNDDFDTLESYVEMTTIIPNSILFNVPFEGHVPVFEKYSQFFVEVAKDFLKSGR